MSVQFLHREAPKLTSYLRPDHFIVLDKMIAGTIKNLNIRNWPVHCFDITGCDLLTISGLTLNNTAGDAPNAVSSGLPAAHNSDGFDISSSTNVVLENTVVMNQDDCVAVTSGTNSELESYLSGFLLFALGLNTNSNSLSHSNRYDVFRRPRSQHRFRGRQIRQQRNRRNLQ